MKTYTPKTNVTGCLMSEKYNGIFCHWTGYLLRSKNGNIFNAPKSFTDQLPDGMPFRGELYIPGAGFEAIKNTVQNGGDWSAICIMVFHAVIHSPVCRIIEYTRCTSTDAAQRFFETVTAAGGEGIVLTDPNGTEYKMKNFIDDEAKALELIGNSLHCLWQGKRIKLGGSIAKKSRALIEAGKQITFRYTELTSSGLPFQPRFVTVRDYE